MQLFHSCLTCSLHCLMTSSIWLSSFGILTENIDELVWELFLRNSCHYYPFPRMWHPYSFKVLYTNWSHIVCKKGCGSVYSLLWLCVRISSELASFKWCFEDNLEYISCFIVSFERIDYKKFRFNHSSRFRGFYLLRKRGWCIKLTPNWKCCSKKLFVIIKNGSQMKTVHLFKILPHVR